MYEKHEKDGLTWADLIVYAGTKSNEWAGVEMLPFCPGRTDTDNAGEVVLTPRDYYTSPVIANKDNMRLMGLNAYEYVALAGRLRPKEMDAK